MNAVAALPNIPRYIKRSASGLFLKPDATDWGGVYLPRARDPDTGEIAPLTVARTILPIRGTFELVNKACGEADLCGEKASRSIGMREFINYLMDDHRTGPCLDPEFFTIPDPWQWIWTSDPCAPLGYAFDLYLGYGDVDRGRQSNLNSALACRPGQVPGLLEYLATLEPAAPALADADIPY